MLESKMKQSNDLKIKIKVQITNKLIMLYYICMKFDIFLKSSFHSALDVCIILKYKNRFLKI